jgi:hypothetical protein
MDRKPHPSATRLFASIRLQLRALPPEEQEKFRQLVLDESKWESESAFTMLGLGLQIVAERQRTDAERQKNSRRSRPENKNRNDQIRAARKGGKTLGEIAQKFSITIEAVKGVLRRGKRARPAQ